MVEDQRGIGGYYNIAAVYEAVPAVIVPNFNVLVVVREHEQVIADHESHALVEQLQSILEQGFFWLDQSCVDYNGLLHQEEGHELQPSLAGHAHHDEGVDKPP